MAEQEETQTQGIDWDKLNETVNKSVEESVSKQRQQEQLQQRVLKHLEKKSEGLTEEGKKQYSQYLADKQIQEGETPEQAIDRHDDYLEFLKSKYSVDNETGDEQEQETEEVETKTQKKKEPVSRNKGVEITNEEDEISPDMEPYSTLEGYVQAKNNRYNSIKSPKRYTQVD